MAGYLIQGFLDELEAEEIRIGPQPIMIEWDISKVDSMFGTNWETSQVNAILRQLDLYDDKDGFVAGGAMVRNFLKMDIFRGDFDIFAVSEDAKERLTTKLTGKLGAPVDTKYTKQYELKLGARKIKIQLICNGYYADPEARMGQFDFDHCRIAFYRGKLISSDSAFTNLALKNLQVEYIRDPSYSMYRLCKYMDLGFTVATDAIKKLTYMVNHKLSNQHVTAVAQEKLTSFEAQKKEESY